MERIGQYFFDIKKKSNEPGNLFSKLFCPVINRYNSFLYCMTNKKGNLMRVLNTSEENHNENGASNSGDAFDDDECDDLYQNDLLD